ncbi:hypothetical protein L226DRAFT_573371 [Lentinus tigrinus ALCF2SS1-7]|uniref:uncharacterized protein n=1 Tax=Lentinus tigrinus ALCF2SS1-7 TaxID=1328758 RepID=UPI001165DD62|nr:hypothetical protein L226DRAFT_573371 [Lentinus tigrinus ALCF2SS1-7]
MGDITLGSGVASEFFKYLNAQLKDTREQLQRANEENVALKEELEALQSLSRPASRTNTESDEVECLRDEMNRLREELNDARETAKRHENEAATWRTRYEQLKPQLINSAAHAAQLMETMREDWTASMPQDTPTGPTLDQFRTLLRSLPGVAASAKPGASRIVFSGTRLPLLSKASLNACIGGFGFFGDYLKWSSQHAYSIFPEYRYNPKPADDEPTWTPAKEWVSLAGQQRELLYVEDGNICYAGTFLCHAGPQSVKVEELGDDSFVNALARKTFNVNIKNPQSRQSKAKTYVPLLANLYTEGTATVRILGLQRVGFNEKLFQILRRAYDKRDRKGAAGANTSTPDAEPTSTKKRKKQNIDFFAELFGEPEEAEGGIPGPSKVPRLDESALMFDETTVWRS